MLKYDLDDLGYEYKGAATTASKEIKVGPWNIIDIPKDIDEQKVKNEFKRWITNVCAVEVPTSLKCNLRCQYCYVADPRMKNKDVTTDDVVKILESSSQMFPGLMRENINPDDPDSAAHITSWGAEPFFNIDTLEAVSQFGHDYYGKDNYVLALSTNGTIWSKRIEQLFVNLVKDNAFRDMQISLDGPPNVQNKNRPLVNGKPSFDLVEKFTYNYSMLMQEIGDKQRKHHFCSTIHLHEDDFVETWIEAARFFSTPNQWYTSPFLPMRITSEDMVNEHEINKFVEAQKRMLELVKERVKEGILIMDYYTSKLFETVSCTSRNANPFCSAMDTQVAIDLDGSIYPCHGPITTPTYKPWLWFGNLFDKTISYTKWVRNIHYQFTQWNKAKCTDCPVYHYSTGSLCYSCGPHNLAVSGEPTINSIYKCKAFTKSLKYWTQIGKMVINGNPILDHMPIHTDNEYMLSAEEKIPFKIEKGMHFDRNYDGFIDRSIQKICDKNININDMYFENEWWNFDDFFEECNTKKD